MFGETVNPLNTKFTPGGSSSGEGSLVASGGSVLGFGSDIAGSIRCPAHMCGIAGLKPTMNRISKRGLQGNENGYLLLVYNQCLNYVVYICILVVGDSLVQRVL